MIKMKRHLDCCVTTTPGRLHPPPPKRAFSGAPRRSLVKAVAYIPRGSDFFTLAEKLTYKTENLWSSQDIPRTLECTPHNPHAWSGVVVSRGDWAVMERSHDRVVLRGRLEIRSTNTSRDVIVSDLAFRTTLVSEGNVSDLESVTRVVARHEQSNSKEKARDSVVRKDDYWTSFILTPSSRTYVEVQLTIRHRPAENHPSFTRSFGGGSSSPTPGPPAASSPRGSPPNVPEDPLLLLQAVKVAVKYQVYGPRGLTSHVQDIILPLAFPKPVSKQEAVQSWRICSKEDNCAMALPIRTHLLCHMDDPVNTVEAYAGNIMRPGDVVVLNESALAIMQGRYRNPSNVKPGLLARLACRLFKPASSLGTACGLQALIDLVGRVRVIFALFFGILGRLVGIRGAFYMLAGEQAKLIDDVAGTLAPYDKHIVLGPARAQQVAQAISTRFPGIGAVIADANDLGSVDILGASTGVDAKFVKACLKDNPAGNSDERTPLVLIRPCYSGQITSGEEDPGVSTSDANAIGCAPQNPFFS